ncbi:MAG: AbrB/MazE/SpoVT family DNA-binding domain-containing protein [Candidatus Aenigmarchaeota archaeon]|nr:AbrB/MazE/SpoVT family DNA-binding domain-containing protein [Candidatus Aenigmarchaeota archaeon]
MTQIHCRTVKIGGSIGIILPKEIVRKDDIKPNQELSVEIKKQLKVRDVFGMFPEWKADTQKLKNEARKGWD